MKIWLDSSLVLYFTNFMKLGNGWWERTNFKNEYLNKEKYHMQRWWNNIKLLKRTFNSINFIPCNKYWFFHLLFLKHKLTFIPCLSTASTMIQLSGQRQLLTVLCWWDGCQWSWQPQPLSVAFLFSHIKAGTSFYKKRRLLRSEFLLT